MKNIVVIGSAHHNTLGMIRCLGIAGYLVDLVIIGDSKNFLLKSRYVNKYYILNELDSLQNLLDTNYNREIEKSIIISCTDAVASYLDVRYEMLKDKFVFFNSGEANRVTNYMDKENQVLLAQKVGLLIPRSYVYCGTIENSIFPCLLKPLKSCKGGKQIVICNNKDDLIRGLLSFDSIDVLVQQLINKEHEIVILGLSVNGNVIIPGYVLKHRDFDGGTLYSTVKPIDSLTANLVNKCKDMVLKMNYEGLFGIELIYSGGHYYFIECNLRNDATTYALAVAGVNLPDLYIKAKSGDAILPIKYSINEIKSIVEFNDFKHRKDFGISVFQWIKEYLSASCKYYFNWRDPMPFFYAPFKRNI